MRLVGIPEQLGSGNVLMPNMRGVLGASVREFR